MEVKLFPRVCGYKQKMIPNSYVNGTDFYKLTKAEARAFVVFELKELVRHRDDIKRIQADIKNVSKVHGIEGLELNALYSEVYGSQQSSGVCKQKAKAEEVK